LTINKMEIMLFARKMDGTGDHHVEWNKRISQKQVCVI
jgi:hypothetical protein